MAHPHEHGKHRQPLGAGSPARHTGSSSQAQAHGGPSHGHAHQHEHGAGSLNRPTHSSGEPHAHPHSHSHADVFHTHAPIHKMKLAFFLSLLILIFELVAGFISNSLALLSDAGHVVTDLAAIGLSWFAMKQALRPPSETHTYGYHRSGILAAFVNAASLFVLAAFILWEAIDRLQNPHPVDSTWMFVGAGVGLAVNVYLALGMSKIDNVNVRSAVLHMVGDAAASAGVIVGGVIIYFTGWYAADPILSVLIAVLISISAIGILRMTIGILMEAVPHGINLQQVADTIRSAAGVREVHHLHVWSLTSGRNALSCHVTLDGTLTIADSQPILRDIEHKLLHLNIGHATIQLGDDGHSHGTSILCEGHDETEHHHHHHHHH